MQGVKITKVKKIRVNIFFANSINCNIEKIKKSFCFLIQNHF